MAEEAKVVDEEVKESEEKSELEEIVGREELQKEDEKQCQTKVNDWISAHIGDAKADFEKIDGMARNVCKRDWQLGIGIKGLTVAMYGVTFEEIVAELKRRESKDKRYFINVASIFGIGFESDDSDGDFDEKNQQLRPGGVRPRIIALDNCVENVIHEEDVEVYTDTRVREWCDKNIREQNGTLMNIATRAVRRIKNEFDYDLRNPEYIWPIFYSCHSSMAEYLHVRRAELELASVELNVSSYYTMKSIDDIKTGEPVIRYEPKQWMKLALKNDEKREQSEALK